MSTDKINKFLDSKVSSGALPGVVVMAVDRTGQTIHSYVTGPTGLESTESNTIDTVFWIASFTKAVTAMACMQLVEQGKIGLDEPVERFIPELTSKAQILTGFDSNDEPQFIAPKNKITLRHLLTHTAGLGYTFFNHNLRKYAERRGDELEWRFKKTDFSLPLSFEPGTAWEYGLNIDWAGQIVEAISGLSLEDYFQQNIFSQCGMKDTTFCIHARKDMMSRLAKPHQRTPEGELQARGQPPYSVDSPEAHHGGAGLFSTAPDYCRFLSVFLADGLCPTTGQRVLKKETVDLMNEHGIKEKLTGTTLDSPVPAANELLTNPLPDLMPGARKQWGLSFLLTPEAVGSRAPGSFWWAGIMNCFWWADRKNGVAGVTLNQILPFGDIEVATMWQEWEATVYSLHKGS